MTIFQTRATARSQNGPTGSRRTQEFYDRHGWTEQNGQLVDLELFGNTEDGPVRRELHEIYQRRIHDSIGRAGTELDLLECGCGGSPQLDLLDLCASYTGADFSGTGLEQAARKLEGFPGISDFRKADACDLPFGDGQFDAVYSARMIYHIPDEAAQAKAVSEMLRVTRPGGAVVIITANPFPLLFPVRSFRRLVALTPVLGELANRFRPAPPLPYQPMSLRWFRNQVGDKGSIDMISNGFPTTAFNQGVSEFSTVGGALWRGMRAFERRFPRASVWLGNYTQITIVKSHVDPSRN